VEDAHIQQTNPVLDVLMVKLQEIVTPFLNATVREIIEALGAKSGQITITTRAASLGETDELMFVTLIKAENLTVAEFKSAYVND